MWWTRMSTRTMSPERASLSGANTFPLPNHLSRQNQALKPICWSTKMILSVGEMALSWRYAKRQDIQMVNTQVRVGIESSFPDHNPGGRTTDPCGDLMVGARSREIIANQISDGCWKTHFRKFTFFGVFLIHFPNSHLLVAYICMFYSKFDF